jgi:ubiquinol-cytochrome c reductase subunit 7
MSALAKVFDPIFKVAARAYQGALATELNKMGLRYEDLMSRDEPEVNEALELADADVVEGRYRRLKRASDLSFKAKELQDYAPDMILEPFKREISADVDKILNRDLEFDLLNNHKIG